jgi:hypothetical protein
MANKRLSELTELAATEVASSDLLLVTDVSTLESKKLRADSLKTYILSSGVLTASVTNATNAISASYINPAGVGLIPSSSYSLSSSFSNQSYSSQFSATASYIVASNISGSVPSSSYSATASYVSYTYNNGRVENSQTASYVNQALTASYLWYQGTFNGSASFALSASHVVNPSASYLRYNGIPNGTASAALSVLTNEITSSYLVLQAGRTNGTASFAVSSSYIQSSSYSLFSTTASFLRYTGLPNGTSSYSIFSLNSEFANSSIVSSFSDSSSLAYISTFSDTSSFCMGSASFARKSISASYVATSSYVVPDPKVYRMYGPYNTTETGGSTTTTEAYMQNFFIKPPTAAGTTIIIKALLDCKVPITTTDTDLYTVDLYLDYTEPGNTHSYGPIDTSRPNNYINFYATGAAFVVNGYSRQSIALGSDWNPVSGSWYRLRVKSTNGALIDTTRGVTFFVFVDQDTTITKTSYPPF